MTRLIYDTRFHSHNYSRVVVFGNSNRRTEVHSGGQFDYYSIYH